MIDRIVDTRVAMYHLGVDYGSNANVLLVKGLLRLVWAKSTKTLIGIKGLGTLDSPCTLQIRAFKRDHKGDVVYDGSRGKDEIIVGGRLSKRSLQEVKDVIDLYFGDGATDLLDPRKTVLMDGRDELSEWINARRNQR